MANSKISALTSAATVAGTEVLPIVQSSSTVKVAISDLNPGLSTILATKGGTGQTSYAVGDLLYASTTTALSKLADVATGNALISGGVGVAPAYGKIGLTTHVNGILPVANGGTNASTASITSFNNITGYTASGATGTTSTNLVFSTSPSITTPILVGNATLSTGNLIPSTAAKGVNFTANTPAAGMTSQLLNWYEEGTFTPTLTTDGTNFTSVSYTTQTGNYTRIGRSVSFSLNIYTSAVVKGLASGNVQIGGLPFVQNGSGIRCSPVIGAVLLWGGDYPSAGEIQDSSAKISLFKRATANGTTSSSVVADVATVAGNFIRMSGTYFV